MSNIPILPNQKITPTSQFQSTNSGNFGPSVQADYYDQDSSTVAAAATQFMRSADAGAEMVAQTFRQIPQTVLSARELDIRQSEACGKAAREQAAADAAMKKEQGQINAATYAAEKRKIFSNYGDFLTKPKEEQDAILGQLAPLEKDFYIYGDNNIQKQLYDDENNAIQTTGKDFIAKSGILNTLSGAASTGVPFESAFSHAMSGQQLAFVPVTNESIIAPLYSDPKQQEDLQRSLSIFNNNPKLFASVRSAALESYNQSLEQQQKQLNAATTSENLTDIRTINRENKQLDKANSILSQTEKLANLQDRGLNTAKKQEDLIGAQLSNLKTKSLLPFQVQQAQVDLANSQNKNTNNLTTASGQPTPLANELFLQKRDKIYNRSLATFNQEIMSKGGRGVDLQLTDPSKALSNVNVLLNRKSKSNIPSDQLQYLVPEQKLINEILNEAMSNTKNRTVKDVQNEVIQKYLGIKPDAFKANYSLNQSEIQKGLVGERTKTALVSGMLDLISQNSSFVGYSMAKYHQAKNVPSILQNY